jgi:hypothetical protein
VIHVDLLAVLAPLHEALRELLAPEWRTVPFSMYRPAMQASSPIPAYIG